RILKGVGLSSEIGVEVLGLERHVVGHGSLDTGTGGPADMARSGPVNTTHLGGAFTEGQTTGHVGHESVERHTGTGTDRTEVVQRDGHVALVLEGVGMLQVTLATEHETVELEVRADLDAADQAVDAVQVVAVGRNKNIAVGVISGAAKGVA